MQGPAVLLPSRTDRQMGLCLANTGEPSSGPVKHSTYKRGVRSAHFSGNLPPPRISGRPALLVFHPTDPRSLQELFVCFGFSEWMSKHGGKFSRNSEG